MNDSSPVAGGDARERVQEIVERLRAARGEYWQVQRCPSCDDHGGHGREWSVWAGGAQGVRVAHGLYQHEALTIATHVNTLRESMTDEAAALAQRPRAGAPGGEALAVALKEALMVSGTTAFSRGWNAAIEEAYRFLSPVAPPPESPDGPLLTCPWCGADQTGRIANAQISHLIECGDRSKVTPPPVAPLDRAPGGAGDPENREVTVCAACLTAACWLGEFYCQESKTANVTTKTVRELRALNLEHSDYWQEGRANG